MKINPYFQSTWGSTTGQPQVNLFTVQDSTAFYWGFAMVPNGSALNSTESINLHSIPINLILCQKIDLFAAGGPAWKKQSRQIEIAFPLLTPCLLIQVTVLGLKKYSPEHFPV